MYMGLEYFEVTSSVSVVDVCTIKVSNYTIIYATEDGGAKKANILKIRPIIIRRKHNNKESLVMF